ncbi:MAG: IS200/IS605 family transposase [Armatimonadota bacterium]
MSHTYSNLLIHLIFATKNRRPLINDSFKNRLYGYMTGIINNEFGTLIRINGMPDHTHVVMAQKPTVAIADLVRVLKSRSSGWVHDTFPYEQYFAWQPGYGAFSVDESRLEELIKYVENQEAHHHTVTFQEEYLRFLQEYHVEYDERYLWEE